MNTPAAEPTVGQWYRFHMALALLQDACKRHGNIAQYFQFRGTAQAFYDEGRFIEALQFLRWSTAVVLPEKHKAREACQQCLHSTYVKGAGRSFHAQLQALHGRNWHGSRTYAPFF